MATVRIEIVKKKCQGYGRCMAVAPAVFALGDDRKAQIVDPAGATDDQLLQAAKSCPYRAITVTSADGQQLFPPPRKPV
jgi:ferredoxin